MIIWRFLNSRFVSSLCAATVILTGVLIGLRPLRTFLLPVEGDNLQRVETLAHLQLLTFAEVSTADDHVQKYVGKVRNNSSSLITNITGAVGFYDEDKVLKDLFTERLEGISLLKPGEEAAFAIVRQNDRGHSGSQSPKTASTHLELRFVDVSIARETP